MTFKDGDIVKYLNYTKGIVVDTTCAEESIRVLVTESALVGNIDRILFVPRGSCVKIGELTVEEMLTSEWSVVRYIGTRLAIPRVKKPDDTTLSYPAVEV